MNCAPMRLLAPIALAVTVSSCQATTTGDLYEGIGYREARHAEISAARDYRECVNEALALDEKARAGGDAARYGAVASMLEVCEESLGREAKSVEPDERMRAYALSIQNFVKGRDAAQARRNLETFKTTFEGRDLYFADGSSFIDTMDLILNDGDDHFGFRNVSRAVRDEMRRIAYWKNR